MVHDANPWETTTSTVVVHSSSKQLDSRPGWLEATQGLQRYQPGENLEGLGFVVMCLWFSLSVIAVMKSS